MIARSLFLGCALVLALTRVAHATPVVLPPAPCVPGTLAAGVTDFIKGGGSNDPSTWNTADEAKLLNLYIKRRNQTNMTDSNNRAQRVRQAVTNGLASDQRGSFQP